MGHSEHEPVHSREILSTERIGSARSALADPSRGPTDPSLRLDESERRSIRKALRRSQHPLTAFAESLLDQWDELAADDRVAGLLLLAQIVNAPGRTRGRDTGRAFGRGVER